ncbi:MAG: M48 family metallopeptidase [Planctomycetota bacterium]
MQLVLIGLAIGVFLHDSPPLDAMTLRLPGYSLALVVLLPKLVLGGGYWLACVGARQRLAGPGAVRRIKRLNLFTAALPVAALVSYLVDLAAGGLVAVRGEPDADGFGPRDWVLVDELVLMLPTLGLIAWGWWAYYPIDRRLREVSLLRRADEGLPLYPVWSRGQYVVTQMRNHFALILGPLLLIMAWSELLVVLRAAERLSETQQLWLTPVGVGVAFLFAPLLIRRLWDTVPLPPGPVRDKLLSMCERHGVAVRDLLLWRTFGGMINAAVMGLFGRVRFILLSDGLLDQVHEHEVEAVMAHELAHVRLKHLWWLLLSAAAALTAITLVGEQLGRVIGSVFPDLPQWTIGVGYTLGFAWWASMFGWVSRRIERQADTFAARHMVRVHAEYHRTAKDEANAETAPHVFNERSVQTMIGALQRVADLNHIATTRRSWRHGSIAWRQRYLRTLVGQSLHHTSVDRQIFGIQIACLVVLIPVLVWQVLPLVVGDGVL